MSNDHPNDFASRVRHPAARNPYASPVVYDQEDDFYEYHTEPFYSRHGRIGRMRYLVYCVLMGMLMYLIAVAAIVLTTVIASLISPELVVAVMAFVMFILIMPLMFYASFVPAIRRLNDLNYTGWLSLLLFVPLVNLLLTLYLLVAPGTDGINNYGVPAEPPSTRVKVFFWLFVLVWPFFIFIFFTTWLDAYQEYVQTTHLSPT